MKKIVLLFLVLLMAVPVMADVTVTCDDDANCVTVSYASDANLIRAFGLDITVDNGVVITKVEVVDANYRIYPGQIVIDDGNITDYNTPYAPGSIPGSSVTVEMGSLYTTDSNYDDDVNSGYNMIPGLSGVLLKFYAEETTSVSDCNYTVTENSACGGVVMENPDQNPNVSTPLCSGKITFAVPPAGVATNPTPAAAATCQGTGTTNMSTTLSWTVGANTATQDVYFGTTNPPTTVVAAGIPASTTTYAASGMSPYKLYYWKIVEKNSAGDPNNAASVWCFVTGAQTGKPCCANETTYPKCLGDVRLTTPFIPPPGNNLVQSTDVAALLNLVKTLPAPFYRCTTVQNSGTCPVCYDVDGNGLVNSLDVAALLNRVKAFPAPLFRHTCPYPSCSNP